jgi:hypothetical protein
VNFQVLDPPFGFLFESLRLRSWLKGLCQSWVLFSLFPVSFFEKKKRFLL